MKTRLKIVGQILLIFALVLGLLSAGANAQTSKAPVQKKTAQAKKVSASPPKPELEPRAVELLKATSERLAAAHSLSFTALEIFEFPSRQGHPLAYATKSEVTLQRPDRLRVLMAGDGPASEFYYDGKVMMAYAPAENLLAVADAPPTIDATLQAAYNAAGIYFPFTDLIVADPYKDMSDGLKLAYYMGQSRLIGGTTTDIVAYIDDDVFLQVWIGVDDKLPRLVHAVFLDDPERMRHELEFSNWQLEVPVSPESFTSSNAASAKHIPFANPHPQPAAGAKLPAKANATKIQH